MITHNHTHFKAELKHRAHFKAELKQRAHFGWLADFKNFSDKQLLHQVGFFADSSTEQLVGEFRPKPVWPTSPCPRSEIQTKTLNKPCHTLNRQLNRFFWGKNSSGYNFSTHLYTGLVWYSNGRLIVRLLNDPVFKRWSENRTEKSLFMVQNVKYIGMVLQAMWLYHLNMDTHTVDLRTGIETTIWIYEQMPQAWVWAHHISILVRLLPDHRNKQVKVCYSDTHSMNKNYVYI